MDLGLNVIESEFEFWPIQHPIEPSDEDRPVKCPISDTSPVNNDGGRHEEQFSDSLRKRTEHLAVMHKQDMVVVTAAEPPVRVVRKRQHTLTHEDHNMVTPLLRMPPIYPYSIPQSITIFDMMQHFNKFES